jgi:hypothetical protein
MLIPTVKKMMKMRRPPTMMRRPRTMSSPLVPTLLQLFSVFCVLTIKGEKRVISIIFHRIFISLVCNGHV